jgi:hypothetical protein
MAIELADLVESVVAELLKADAVARQRGVGVLQLGSVDFELTVTFSKQGGPKVRAWVVEFGAEISKEQTHTVKVSYVPYGTVIAEAREAGESSAEGRYEQPQTDS